MTEEKKIKKINVKEFVKKNSGKILLVTSSAVAGIILYNVFKVKPKFISKNTMNLIKVSAERFDTPPNLGIGEVVDCLKYDDGALELMMDKVPITEVGNLGESILKNISDVSENSKLWMLMGFFEEE